MGLYLQDVTGSSLLLFPSVFPTPCHFFFPFCPLSVSHFFWAVRSKEQKRRTSSSLMAQSSIWKLILSLLINQSQVWKETQRLETHEEAKRGWRRVPGPNPSPGYFKSNDDSHICWKYPCTNLAQHLRSDLYSFSFKIVAESIIQLYINFIMSSRMLRLGRISPNLYTFISPERHGGLNTKRQGLMK